MQKNVDISVVIPVFNSATSLKELYARLSTALVKTGKSYQLVLIDDGSKDNSWQVLTDLQKNDPDHVTTIQLDGNFGQHQAIVCGFNFSRGDLILTMDDDLQHPPEEIHKLIDKQESARAEVVYGIYKTNRNGMFRSTSSFLVQKSVTLFGEHSGNVGSSFRLFKASIANQISEKPQSFMFIDEVIHWYTGNIETVAVEHHERKEGKSGYGFFKLLRLYFGVVVNYTAWPLKIMIYGGALIAMFSFILGIFFIFRKLYFKVDVEGFTAIITAILFSASCIMLSLGIIGKYLFKIYQNQNGKPPYAMKKIR